MSPKRASGAAPADPPVYTPALTEPRYSQSLERGIAILSCFTPTRSELGVADIASELGMSRPTTHRYLITLVALGYVEQVPSRKYRLGLRVADLGMAAMGATPIADHARPQLQQLRQQTGLAVVLAVLDGSEAVVLERLRDLHAPLSRRAPDLPPGTRLRLGSTAAGKMLLALAPDEQRAALLRGTELTKAGPNAIRSVRALRVELEQAADAGFAVDEEESATAVHALAAPVRGHGEEVLAAVEVRAHAASMDVAALIDAVHAPLAAACAVVSARLGHRPEAEKPRR